MPVTVAEAVVKAIPVELTAVGAVEAYATVTVRAQVEGQVTAVHLREGQCVKAGDLLFTIDPRPFESQLKLAQANLARDTVQLENARTLLARNASVVAKGYVSQEQYDQCGGQCGSPGGDGAGRRSGCGQRPASAGLLFHPFPHYRLRRSRCSWIRAT